MRTAVAARRHPGVGVVDDDRPSRTHTESAGGFQKHCGIGLSAVHVRRDALDADAEQVVDPGGFQELPALRARRIDRRGDADVE